MNRNSQAPIVPLPEGIQVLYDRDAFIIRRRWFSALAIFLLFFALFWNGFMVVWMGIALISGAWIMAAFGSIHALIGLGLAYYCLASFLNTTDVSVDPNYLTVRHYPLPWPGAKKLKVHNIQQLYTKEQISRSKNGTSISYRVHAITVDNREQRLVTGLKDATQAKYIEREIEKVLGLDDIPVSGEHH